MHMESRAVSGARGHGGCAARGKEEREGGGLSEARRGTRGFGRASRVPNGDG